ncbi:PD-(D/E)XK nuclease family protein [uncultured Nostoc sp.]|uniref:PD-(D/E)XK nuclease family protein n=1 Tax=uncultured Nostoc sp. TaxID=340711 RepID=UPI0035CC7661
MGQQLRWSISRNQVLNTCERRYYFQYLLPSALKSDNPELREVAILKKLKTLPMWQGEIFHTAVARYLKHIQSGRYSSLPDSWVDWLQRKVQQEFDFSEKKKFRSNPWQLSQEGGLALFEHEYDHPLDADSCNRVIQTVKNYMNKFEQWAEAVELKQSIRSAKQVWIEPDIFKDKINFNINHVDVVTKVDLAFLKNSKFEIYDWKSSKIQRHSSDDMSQAEFQAGVYQLWSHLTLQIPVEKITSHLVYFGGETVEQQSIPMSYSLKKQTLRLVRKNIERELSFVNQQEDVEWNLNDLDYASSCSSCRQCFFKRICRDKT